VEWVYAIDETSNLLFRKLLHNPSDAPGWSQIVTKAKNITLSYRAFRQTEANVPLIDPEND